MSVVYGQPAYGSMSVFAGIILNCIQPPIVLKLAIDDMIHYHVNAIATSHTLRRIFNRMVLPCKSKQFAKQI